MSIKVSRFTAVAVAVGAETKLNTICAFLANAEHIVDKHVVYDRNEDSDIDAVVGWIQVMTGRRLLFLCSDLESALHIARVIWPRSGPRKHWVDTVIKDALVNSLTVFDIYSNSSKQPTRLFKLEYGKLVEVETDKPEKKVRDSEEVTGTGPETAEIS